VSVRWAVYLSGAVLVAAIVGACGAEAPAPAADTPVVWPAMPRYEAMAVPETNPMTPAKVELGRMLYYDTRLSGDGKRSCYSCHLAENGLTDGRALAVGAFERTLTRSAPTMWNIGYHAEWYWDGRAKTLEGQAKAAWSGANMGANGKDGPSQDQVCATLMGLDDYATRFTSVFGGPCSPDNASQALAAFMRTIVANDSAWARFRAGETTALSEPARRGYALFDGKAQCSRCHSGVLLTDLQFHNIGVGMDAKEPDLGRFNATKEESHRGAFKTPTLLDVARSAPYFHNGSAATLEAAVDRILSGGFKNKWLDPNLQPVTLTAAERDDLLQFLRELTVNYTIAPPALPK
jgi:cytochrome c peroxidase